LKPPNSFPQLQTDRLGLRALTVEDSAAIFQDLADADVARFLVKPYTDLQQAKNLVKALIDEYQQGIGLTWVLTIKETQTFVGTCSYWFKASAQAEVQFEIAKQFWGKGLMREALQAIIRYGFEGLGLDEIEAYVSLENQRARTLLTALGFKPPANQLDKSLLVLLQVNWKSQFV
jgi:ribosomal-protein-alanine N-acetyltransferase